MRTLAERLKAEREAAGLTQEDLAKKSGVGQSMIGNLESGLRKGSAKLPNIAAALGLHALWLKEERGPKHLDAGQSLQDGLYVTDPELIEIITELQNAPEVVRRQMLKEAKSVAYFAEQLKGNGTDG